MTTNRATQQSIRENRHRETSVISIPIPKERRAVSSKERAGKCWIWRTKAVGRNIKTGIRTARKAFRVPERNTAAMHSMPGMSTMKGIPVKSNSAPSLNTAGHRHNPNLSGTRGSPPQDPCDHSGEPPPPLYPRAQSRPALQLTPAAMRLHCREKCAPIGARFRHRIRIPAAKRHGPRPIDAEILPDRTCRQSSQLRKSNSARECDPCTRLESGHLE